MAALACGGTPHPALSPEKGRGKRAYRIYHVKEREKFRRASSALGSGHARNPGILPLSFRREGMREAPPHAYADLERSASKALSERLPRGCLPCSGPRPPRTNIVAESELCADHRPVVLPARR